MEGCLKASCADLVVFLSRPSAEVRSSGVCSWAGRFCPLLYYYDMIFSRSHKAVIHTLMKTLVCKWWVEVMTLWPYLSLETPCHDSSMDRVEK